MKDEGTEKRKVLRDYLVFRRHQYISRSGPHVPIVRGAFRSEQRRFCRIRWIFVSCWIISDYLPIVRRRPAVEVIQSDDEFIRSTPGKVESIGALC